MPTYEYHCPKCGKFDEFQKITEPALETCPKCGSAIHRVISGGLGVIFHGSGYYSTDHRSADYRAKAREDAGGKAETGGK